MAEHPTLDPSPAEQRYPSCQLCGAPIGENDPLTKWYVHTYQTLEGIAFHILACPKPSCRRAGSEKALSIYQKRVRRGLDLNYH